MLDVMSNIQEVYHKWEKRNKPEIRLATNTGRKEPQRAMRLLSGNELKRFYEFKQKRRQFDKEATNVVSEFNPR